MITEQPGYAKWMGIVHSNNGTVNMRAGCGTGTELLRVLTNGDAVEVINTENGTDNYVWYQVMIGSQLGYIRSDLVQHPVGIVQGTTYTTIPMTNMMRTLSASPLYHDPMLYGDPENCLDARQYVRASGKLVTNDGNVWYYVTVGNDSGWIPELYLKVYPKETFCGGDNPLQSTEHEMQFTEDGVYECGKCGYHIACSKPAQHVAVSPAVKEGMSFATFINYLEDLETGLEEYRVIYHPDYIYTPVLRAEMIAALFRCGLYDGPLWFALTLRLRDEALLDYLKNNHYQTIIALRAYLTKVNDIDATDLPDSTAGELDIFGDGSTSLDIKHFMATMDAHLSSNAPRCWSGWGRDLASLAGQVGSTASSEAETYSLANSLMGKSSDGQNPFSKFGYADLCSDIDAIDIATRIKQMLMSEYHPVSSAMEEYYEQEDFQASRFALLQNDILQPSMTMLWTESDMQQAVIAMTLAEVKSLCTEIMLLSVQDHATFSSFPGIVGSEVDSEIR